MTGLIRTSAATALILAVGVGTIGAASAAPIAAPPSITMPTALVMGGVLTEGIVPGSATVTGCEPGNTAAVAVVHRSPDGTSLGVLGLGLYRASDGGIVNVDMTPVVRWLLGSGVAPSGSISLSATCSDTGESGEAAMPLYALGIALPVGVTVLTLTEQQKPGTATISVCPGDVSISASYSNSVQGLPFEVPIQLVLPQAADSDGTVDFSLSAIRDWLIETQPAAGGSVVVSALCYLPVPGSRLNFPPVASASTIILPGGMLGGPGPVPPVPDAPGEALPTAEHAPASSLGQPAMAAATQTAQTATLAATGAPFAVVAMLGGAAMLLGGVVLRGPRRNRRREFA